jgi:hypothetical protein
VPWAMSSKRHRAVLGDKMYMTWISSWAWSLPLTALTTIIHIGAIAGMAATLTHAKRTIEKWKLGRVALGLVALGLLGTVGWAVSALTGLESAIWALAYLRLGAVDTFADAMLYSVNALTTLGSSGLHLEHRWRMMGALEAANGVMLFGISTGFAAAITTKFWGLFEKPTDVA